MQKIVVIVTIFLVIFVFATPVKAQAPSSYESSVTVTNVSETNGTVNLIFYNSDGSIADDSISDPIEPLETKFYTTFPVSSGFEGSMVIQSNVPLASTTTLMGKDSSGQPMNYASYIGVSNGSNNVYLPLLMDSNYGFNTNFSVQNTSSSTVDVSISYSDGLIVSDIEDLAPYASIVIENQAESHSVKKFSAQLEATGSIAVAVVQWSDGSYGKQLHSSNGFTGLQGTPNPVIPMVNQNNYGFWTAIPIQNLGNQDTVVTLTYTPTKAGTSCTETLTIPAKGQAEFGSYAHVFDPQTPGTTCILGERFVGSAVVTQNSTNQPLIGLMNQGTTIKPGYEKAEAMMTLNPDLATSKIVFPEIYQWYGGDSWWSSITIVNVSGGTLPVDDITCRAVGNSGSSGIDMNFYNSESIPDGEGWIIDLYKDFGPMPNGFLGGISCISTSGGEILGTVNNLGHTAPDTLDAYTLFEGINFD